MELEGDAVERHPHRPVCRRQAHPLLVHPTVLRVSGWFAAANQFHAQFAQVLAEHNAGFALGDTGQVSGGAEVPAADPQVPFFHRSQHAGQPCPLLSVGVFTRKDVDRQPQPWIKHHDVMAGQGSDVEFPQFADAPL